jgi:DNA-binding transcriptional MerR regulator
MLKNLIDNDEYKCLVDNQYIEDYPSLDKHLTTPRFTINQLGVNARDATYWDSKGILPKLKNTNTTRRKYTLIQAVWIKIIQQLRSFDVSLNLIKKYKDSILENEINVGELIEREEVKKLIEKIAQQQGHLKEFQNLMNSQDFVDELNRSNINNFELIVKSTIVFKRDFSLILTPDGTNLPYCYDKHAQFKEQIEGFDELMKSPHIVISISAAIRELIDDWHEKPWFDDISLITREEQQILKILREERTVELQIFKSGNKPERVIQTSEKPLDAIKEFSKQIIGNGYQEMSVKIRGGKPVLFKNSVSIKLK